MLYVLVGPLYTSSYPNRNDKAGALTIDALPFDMSCFNKSSFLTFYPSSFSSLQSTLVVWEYCQI